MVKKRSTGKSSDTGYIRKKEQILQLCYNRLEELLPECNNEITLLKCIEILEKQTEKQANPEKPSFSIISDTLERMDAVQKILSDKQHV